MPTRPCIRPSTTAATWSACTTASATCGGGARAGIPPAARRSPPDLLATTPSGDTLGEPSLKTNSPARVLFASMVGTTIEYFDFYIYATAAVLVFPRLFFPAGDPASATLQ